MNRWVSFLLSLVFVLSMTACSSGTSTNSNKVEINDPSSPPVKPTPAEIKGKIEDENKDDKKKLVISILGVNDFYEKAKQKYEAANPNVTIEYKEFGGEDSSGVLNPAQVEKYIKQTTTEILSGEGADLFAITSIELPIEKYISKKAFVNLNELIQQDSTFDTSKYHMNILEHSQKSGGLYILPTKFYLQVLFGDKVNIDKSGVTFDDSKWTWSEFEEVGKKLAAKGIHDYTLGGNTEPESMLNLLVSDNYAQLVDGAKQKANFDSIIFTDLLERVKNLYEDKIITKESVHTEDSFFNLSEIYSPRDYLERLAIFYKDGTIYQKPHTAEQKSGIAFGGLQEIAMNANSKVKGTAWDFMKFLMSEEMQSIPEQQGFSIIKSVNDEMIEKLANEVKNGTATAGKGGTLKVSEEDNIKLKAMLTEASLPITFMNKVQSIVAEEAKAYFTGQKSAEAVSKLIQNKVSTYINE
ncbi:extracellular solute-binding protein [Paenibacillus sp. GSMTC-2017]|uniref:ABC transporter substrate-binding protein n=1 Tax=Paenibacillus sp. GSMTC-2017 TaxID=2794350 RepID=UPI0018D7789A|nr:extracellular solute-binding protein [Paenibacillus sp. GSMTC-2017]MBH5316200.1 extracellular solute-binding protein [Paenibacillus sp. GSMTC-2017]